MKGVVEALYGALKAELRIERDARPFLYPGRAARVGEGWLGELHPTCSRGRGGSSSSTSRRCSAASRDPIQYEDVITFPAVKQDLAFIVDEGVAAGDLIAAAREAAGPELRDLRVFDVYRGEQVGSGKKSIALAAAFQSPERTLSDEDAAAIRERIVQALSEAVRRRAARVAAYNVDDCDLETVSFSNQLFVSLASIVRRRGSPKMTYLKTLARAAGVGPLRRRVLPALHLPIRATETDGPAATPPGQEKKAESSCRPLRLRHRRLRPVRSRRPRTRPSTPPRRRSRSRQRRRRPRRQRPGQVKKAEPGEEGRAPKADHAAKAAKPAQGRQGDGLQGPVGQCSPPRDHLPPDRFLSNPYVVINIPYTAWLHAHSDTTGSHPDLNGNHDKMLKDPASRPGSKDGLLEGGVRRCCGSTSPPTQVTPPAQQTRRSGCPATTTTTEQRARRRLARDRRYKNGQRKYVYITPEPQVGAPRQEQARGRQAGLRRPDRDRHCVGRQRASRRR